jgi:hypothetical protein
VNFSNHFEKEKAKFGEIVPSDSMTYIITEIKTM